MVAFAGDAVRLCPLTLDRARGAARARVARSSGSVSEPGTDLGAALRMARRVLPGGRRDEQAIVLWTDGEDLEQRRARRDRGARAQPACACSRWASARRRATWCRCSTTRAARSTSSATSQATAVRSRLDETLLRRLAQRTRGALLRRASRPGGELPRLMSGARLRSARAGRGRATGRASGGALPGCSRAAGGAALIVDRPRARSGARASSAGSSSAVASGAAAAARCSRCDPAGRPRAAAQSAWARGDRGVPRRALRRGGVAVRAAR